MSDDRKPRWTKWRLMPEVRAWEAVSLSLDIEPEKIKTDEWIDSNHPFNEGDDFNDRLCVLLANLSNRDYFPSPCMISLEASYKHGVRLDEFAAWCLNVGFDIPPELAGLANDAPQAPATSTAPPANVGFNPVTSQSCNDWKAQARAIADEFFDHDTNAKPSVRDSLDGYSSRVMDAMQKRNITGPRGIITNHNTVKREALQGKLWWANKPK